MASLNDDSVNLADLLDASLALKGEQAIAVVITSLIRSAREKLRMEVGFVSQLVSGMRVFRYVDAAMSVSVIHPGDANFLEESFCQRVIDGRLPQLMPDARAHPAASKLKATQEMPVGAHISVPVTLSDGSVFGTFCLFSRYAIPGLNHRSLAMVRIFADIIAELVDKASNSDPQSVHLRREITGLFAEKALTFEPQAILDLNTRKVLGYELKPVLNHCGGSLCCAELMIREADRLGLSSMTGVVLMESMSAEIARLESSAYFVINITPAMLLKFDFTEWLSPEVSRRVVLEFSEHDQISGYLEINQRLQELRDAGMRVSVDGAGAGYASLRHILQLRPEFIKLDSSLIRGVSENRDQQALVEAVLLFARSQGCELLAEGIDDNRDLEYLIHAGLSTGQGPYFS
ncbi:EAL domain-containing protein [Thalassolituus sp.]|jgi:EAL domain-containing protein (putative c-di-GMP-specific phosphodiesterase class I)|uniref:EAL domain-containing protein n=1 Tax=Thalassolituus sp. TaxID=2030822 RepID=UPI0035135386